MRCLQRNVLGMNPQGSRSPFWVTDDSDFLMDLLRRRCNRSRLDSPDSGLLLESGGEHRQISSCEDGLIHGGDVREHI